LLFENNVVENKIPYFRFALSNHCVVCGFSPFGEEMRLAEDTAAVSTAPSSNTTSVPYRSSGPVTSASSIFYVAPHSAIASLVESDSSSDDIENENDQVPSFSSLDRRDGVETAATLEQSSSANQDFEQSSFDANVDSRTGLISFHIVPPEFRRHFPLPVKSHNSYDVLLLCISCHRLATFHLTSLSKELYAELPEMVIRALFFAFFIVCMCMCMCACVYVFLLCVCKYRNSQRKGNWLLFFRMK
jgi:hypothetical protein